MVRLLITFLAAFVVALGGTTGAVIVRARKTATMAADSAKVARVAPVPAAPPLAPATMSPMSAISPLTPTAAPATPTTTAASTATTAATVPSIGTPTTQGQKGGLPAPPAAIAAKPMPSAHAPTVSAPTTPVPVVPAIPLPALVVGGRMSKIFAAMPTKDAAKVLDQMGDADIVTILSAVNDRKAGELLALLPTARAATISKSVLQHIPADK